MTFLGGQVGIFKSCPRVPKLRIWLLRGWGRCLKVTLQTCVPEIFRSCWWGGRANGQACADGERGPHRREQKFLEINKLNKTFPKIYVTSISEILAISGMQGLATHMMYTNKHHGEGGQSSWVEVGQTSWWGSKLDHVLHDHVGDKHSVLISYPLSKCYGKT